MVNGSKVKSNVVKNAFSTVVIPEKLGSTRLRMNLSQ